MIGRTVRYLDQRTGAAPLLRTGLRYLFPEHWSFLLGEVALYAFMVLIATGIYLTFFFEPSFADTTYRGVYAPLQGVRMSEAYRSVVDISFQVKSGLLMRQTHHWAADIFVAAIILHLLRVFFTGAFRKPRELTYAVGLIMLFTSLLEGYLGYSMVDDLLSGMGLVIGYGVALSIPFIGGDLALGLWGAPYPGDASFESRMYIAHVFLLPSLIGALIGVHLLLVALRHHAQFRSALRESERKILGAPMFPAQVPRSLGLQLAVTGGLFLLGGLIQINPIWQWGPYEVYLGTNGAQPDWYLGWLIGALRLVPHLDVVVGNYTLVPNPFWGGALFPLIVLGVLALWPSLEKRRTGDWGFHNALDRPRDAPRRTGFGVAFTVWVILIFVAGSADRQTVFFGLKYETFTWIYRAAVIIVPIVLYFVIKRVCLELQRGDEIEHSREEAEQEALAAMGLPATGITVAAAELPQDGQDGRDGQRAPSGRSERPAQR